MEKSRNRSIGRPILKSGAQESASKEKERNLVSKTEGPEEESPQPESVVKRQSESPRLRVGITSGDGLPLHYGALARLFSDNAVFDGVLPFVYGSAKSLSQAAEKGGREDLKILVQRQIQDIKGRQVQILEPQTSSDDAVEESFMTLQMGIRHLAEGHLRALVSLPLDESKVREKYSDFKNQAVAVAEIFAANPFRMLLARSMRLSFLTTEGRQDMSAYLTAQRIEQRLHGIYSVLQSDFSITTPRIAVLGVGSKGGATPSPIDEEVIKPLVNRLFENGMPIFGPYSSKDFFVKPDRHAFDAVLCMYKEQMEMVFDSCPKEDSCYYTAGLPIIYMEPVFDGSGVEAAFRSLFRAVCMAVDIDSARQQNWKLMENPLGYHAASYRRDNREEN